MKSSCKISNLQWFFPTLKVSQRFFAAANNNKDCTQSLDLTRAISMLKSLYSVAIKYKAILSFFSFEVSTTYQSQ